MDPQGQQSVVVVRRRRRRTRRHRRNRSLRRAALLAAIFGTLLGFWVSLIPGDFIAFVGSYLPETHAPVTHPTRGQLLPPPMPEMPRSRREVYPYSLVPGGVRSVQELRDIFDHDPVLAAHYRNFDFRKARMLRLLQDKTVYVSYRIAGQVYWTTKQVRLHAGELVITDGVITIRSRCGNQVSVAPRTEVSPKEPNIAVLERPMSFFDPPSVVPPPPNMYESSLHRPDFPMFAAPQPNFLIANGPTTGFLFAPSPGVCSPFQQKAKPVYGGPSPGGPGGVHHHKKKGGPCSPGGGGPGETPEPSSIILLSTGLAAIAFRYRKMFGSKPSAQLAQ